MAVGGQAATACPASQAELADLLAWARDHRRSIALRGSGCSYGDAACATDRLVVDVRGLRRILAWDPQTGIVRAEAGATIADIWRLGIVDGWWPAVVSGTMAPTLGGAVAMNIHGKNAYAVGPIGEHVRALKVLLVGGEQRELTPEDPLFDAVCSSFGELAVILEVELQLKRVYSGQLEVLGVSVANFAELFDCFDRHEGNADYLVAWVDGFARGAALGRGLVHAAFQLPEGADPRAAKTLQPAAQELPPRLFGIIPKSWMWWLMKPFAHATGMRLVNAAKYWAGRLLEHGRRYRQSHGAFHFLLDYVPNWKFAYKPGGLIQHQIFIPKASARQVFAEVFALQQRYGLVTWLAVMKRHRPDRFLFSHGVDGYSMAQDFAVTAANRDRLWAMCHEIESLAVAHGGRFYFAKDATLQAETWARSLPAGALQRFWALRQQLDPQGVLQTDLFRRVVAPLTATAAAAPVGEVAQPDGEVRP